MYGGKVSSDSRLLEKLDLRRTRWLDPYTLSAIGFRVNTFYDIFPEFFPVVFGRFSRWAGYFPENRPR